MKKLANHFYEGNSPLWIRLYEGLASWRLGKTELCCIFVMSHIGNQSFYRLSLSNKLAIGTDRSSPRICINYS